LTLRRERWRASAVVLGLVAAGLWAQRSLLAGLTGHVYAQNLPGNDALLHVWTLAWGQHTLRHQPWAPFDANIFFPYPGTLLYSDHLLGLAALLAPFRLVTNDVVFVHNVAVVAAPILNALAMAWLVRALTRDHAAAAFAGLVYGYAPFRFATDLHQIQMLTAWWPPVMLLAASRAVASGRRRWAALAGAALFLQGATGIYLTAFFVPFLAVAHLVWLRTMPFAAHRRGWALLLAAEAAALALLAPSAAGYHAVQSALGSSRSPVLNAILCVLPSALPAYLPLVALTPLFVVGMARAGRDRVLPRADLWFHAAMALGALVLAFGPSIALPGGLGAVRGPYAALMGLPGFDALRAPGRMIHVATIGLAVVAAAGMTRLRQRLPPVAATALAAGFIVLVAWECRTPRFPLQAVPAADELYAAIAADPAVAAYAEIPFGQTALSEQRFQYFSTATWKPIPNGSMGIEPPLHAFLTRRLRRFPAPDTLADLAATGVSHVVVHWAGLAADARAAVLAAASGPAAALRERARSTTATLYALAPPTHPARVPGPALSRDGWRITASENGADAPLAIDDVPETRWASWGAHERRLRAWYDDEPFIDRWWAFIRRQPSRLTLDFGRRERVGAVAVRLRGSDPAIVPLLELEASDDGHRWSRLAAELVAVPDVRALVDRPALGDYAFVLERAQELRHVRLAVHGLDWRVEDVTAHAPR
jgi:hypothetical protein